MTAAVWVSVCVSTPMTTSTSSASMDMRSSPDQMGRSRSRSGAERAGLRRDTPAATGGQAPDQANVSGRAGAGSSERTSPVEGTKPVRRRVTPAAADRQPITEGPTRPASQSGEGQEEALELAQVDLAALAVLGGRAVAHPGGDD